MNLGKLRQKCIEQWKDSKSEIIFICRWSWPMIVSNLLNNVLYLFVNLIFVGQGGTPESKDELAAAALANTWTYGTGGIALGILNALDTLISQSYGAKNFEYVGILVQRAASITSGVSVFIAALWCITDYFLKLVGQNHEISNLAFKYALMLLPGLWFYNMTICMQKYLQGQGLMMPSIYIGLAINGINVFLNYLLVYGMGSYNGMGYLGAPLATSISRIIGFFLMWGYIYVFKLHKKTWFGWTKESITFKGIKEYLTLGIPAAIQHVSEGWCFEVLTILAGLISTHDLDAHNVCYNFTTLTYQISSGISIAVAVRVGHLLGSRHPFQARRAAWVGFILAMLAMIVVAIVLVAARYQIGKIYTKDQDVINIAAKILPIAALFQIFDGGQTIFQGIVRGMGRIKTGAISNFIAFYLITIPFAVGLTFGADVGVTGLWWGLCIGLISIFIGLGIFIVLVKWPVEVEKAKIRTKTLAPTLSLDQIPLEKIPPHLRQNQSDAATPPGGSPVSTDSIISNVSTDQSTNISITVSTTHLIPSSNEEQQEQQNQNSTTTTANENTK
ncbi:multi antimicrobial extrusion family protein [Heterostelium album PN500]|uniref:Multi antimicrobial extrusion family protein n=1 Tax=Heterostelium pallidum (strain ATCC 26659 / Pp 5 / PN500) TaxID=670386 RepID=D3BAX5_HETP5|nr:multi antimicrobial extrusion family protein [Heterostelium album PN500]EFA81712.1 multi antimicrobial extrusion family protein [Heterostelium album PN500]|eukprot:XP_020433829.1 multi antimicrobial extrusion family protein [Heterostelium album PN500]